jgi:hypothetical protein
MTGQDHTREDAKTTTTAKPYSVRKPAEPPENRRELTDKEIAAVAGGATGKHLDTA